jgi:hypothetical protein
MPFVMTSLAGGQNDTDAPTSLSDDQCVVSRNVEFVRAPLGERRRGADAITLPASIENHEDVTFLHTHIPGSDLTAAELWVLGTTGTASSTLARKTTTWTDISLDDAITLTDGGKYRLRGQSLHGKLYLAYNSGQDRLHVYDGSGNVRRTGMAQPAAAPTAANQGSGSLTGTRYYRVRFTEVSGTTVLRRGEPSDALTFAPSGTGLSVRVTRPTAVSEGETHWELEASVDNANFYVIASTALATTTYDDSTAFSPGYADSFDLAPDIGDYTLQPSYKFLVVDRDRLVGLGNHEDPDLDSRVEWCPVKKDPGDGNDERIENDQDPRVDLDPGEGGGFTGGIAVNGSIWAFKQSRIYKLTSTGIRSRAYNVTPISAARGAIEDSMVEGVDQAGNPAVYFLDPAVGPCRIAVSGVKQCGQDIHETWKSINLDAAVVCRALYYPEAKQVHWWIATSGSDTPDLRLVLHVRETRDTAEGDVRRGWSVWDGDSAEALAVCLFAENIESNTARSRLLRPFIGTANDGLVWRTDTGTTDNGTAYAARILSKPFARGALTTQFEIKSGVMIGKAVTAAAIDISVEADFEKFSKRVMSVAFTPDGTESRVIANVDNLNLAEARVMQIEIEDTSPPSGGRWELELLSLSETPGQGG